MTIGCAGVASASAAVAAGAAVAGAVAAIVVAFSNFFLPGRPREDCDGLKTFSSQDARAKTVMAGVEAAMALRNRGGTQVASGLSMITGGLEDNALLESGLAQFMSSSRHFTAPGLGHLAGRAFGQGPEK